MAMTIKFRGLKQYRRRMATADKRLRREMTAKTEQAASIVAERAKQLAPVRTGSYRRAIFATVRDRSGGTTAEIQPRIAYAGQVEKRHRVMERATEQSERDVVNLIGQSFRVV